MTETKKLLYAEQNHAHTVEICEKSTGKTGVAMTVPNGIRLNYAADDALCGDWKEETAEQYEDALDVLPPLQWYGGGFYIPERYTSNICSFHQKWNGKHYTSLQRTSTPRADIIKSLAAWIESQNH